MNVSSKPTRMNASGTTLVSSTESGSTTSAGTARSTPVRRHRITESGREVRPDEASLKRRRGFRCPDGIAQLHEPWGAYLAPREAQAQDLVRLVFRSAARPPAQTTRVDSRSRALGEPDARFDRRSS